MRPRDTVSPAFTSFPETNPLLSDPVRPVVDGAAVVNAPGVTNTSWTDLWLR